MSEQIALGKNENVISNNILSYSLVLFFIKCTFDITNKRLVGQVPNLFWIFPIGTNNVTYPLKNIAGVKIDNKISIKRLIVGILLVLIGISKLSSLFIILLIGILLVISSYEIFLVVQNNSGASISYAVSPLEKSKAQQLVNELNQVIADNV